MTRKLDLTGQRYNSLLVLHLDPTRTDRVHWICKCDCGNLTSVASSNLRSGSVKACGCLAPRKAELTGRRFGRLKVSGFAGMRGGKSTWAALRDCGKPVVAIAGELLRGATKSCGCLTLELAAIARTTHGMTNTAAYRSWASMHSRVGNPNATGYHLYGGRGITISPEWMSFENFYADMGNRPPGKTLDRKDNDLGYCKENCQWSTPLQQANNRRKNRRYLYQESSLTVAQLASLWGVSWYSAEKLAEAELTPQRKERA